MNMNDMILVSVDDHVIEPPDLFKNHLPAHLLDRAPKMQSTKEGTDSVDSWIFEDRVVPNFGLNAVVGRPLNEYGMEPSSYSQIREGTYDVKARVDDMNVNGILGSICFPTFPHFAGSFFLKAKDKALTLAVIQAYNDWHIDGWCGAAPGRFIPLSILPLWDIDLAVAEAKRVAAKGCRTISFFDNPVARRQQDRYQHPHRLRRFGPILFDGRADRHLDRQHADVHRQRDDRLAVLTNLQEIPNAETGTFRRRHRLGAVPARTCGFHV